MVIVGQSDVNPVAAAAVAPGLNRFVLEGVSAELASSERCRPAQGGENKDRHPPGGSDAERGRFDRIVGEKVGQGAIYVAMQSGGMISRLRRGFASLVRTDVPMPIELFSGALVESAKSRKRTRNFVGARAPMWF